MNRITCFFQLLLVLCCLLLIVSACGQPASHTQAHSDGSFAAGGADTLLIGHFNQGSGGASRGLTISGSDLEPVGWTQYA